MNSSCVDLIYLDPPFNSNANYAAPIGSKAAGAAFKDTWGLNEISLAWHGEIAHEHPGLYELLEASHVIHGDSMMAYLIYMAIRIMEMKRLLTPTGSIYLHCDPTAGHYLKLLMDAVFGKSCYRNEIVWSYSASPSTVRRDFPRKHDTILRYTMSSRWVFNADDVRIPYSNSSLQRAQYAANRSSVLEGSEIQLNKNGKIPTTVWTDIQQTYRYRNEKTGYPTQKPLALLRRIILASSDKGNLILDPFCGCATACIAAQDLGREWVGIDISEKAAELVDSRMRKELGMFFEGAHRNDIPERDDLEKVPRYNSPEIKERLYGEQGGYCNGCQTHFEPRNFTVDHIIPQSRGGTNHYSNLQLLCGSCNSIKGDKPHEHLIACLTDKGWIKRRFSQGTVRA